MKQIAIIVLLLISNTMALWGDLGRTLLAQQYYNNENYKEAQNIYEQLLLLNPNSPELNYNLGNTFYNQNKLGKAKYYYQHSLKLSPRDSDIHHNLKIINNQVIDNINSSMSFRSLLNRLVSLIKISEILIIIAGLFTILNISTFIWLKLNKDLAKATSIIVSILIGLSSIGVTYKTSLKSQVGIIIKEKVAIKSGPLNSFDTLFYLHDGTEFTVVNHNEKWTKLKLENGLVGWIDNIDYWKH